MGAYLGELAGLATATCWSFTSISFSAAGRLVGSPVVNRTRLLLAVVFISLFHWVVLGEVLPIHAEPERWFWLGLSGLIGFIVGDGLLFQAFVMIGARLSMLLMALAPVFSVALGWVLLGETLTGQELLGVGLAVGGVMWVLSDRPVPPKIPQRGGGGVLGEMARSTGVFRLDDTRYYVIGILFGLGGAAGQAVGLIASKEGLKGDFSAISGNAIRLLISTIAIWGFTILAGQVQQNFRRIREHPKALYTITFGAVFGPVVGVWLSLVSIQNAPVGIASTLMGLVPVFLIPIGYFLFGERIGRRAIFGTVIAITGTAIIFLQS